MHGASSIYCALSSSVADTTATYCDSSPRDHGLERPVGPGSCGWRAPGPGSGSADTAGGELSPTSCFRSRCGGARGAAHGPRWSSASDLQPVTVWVACRRGLGRGEPPPPAGGLPACQLPWSRSSTHARSPCRSSLASPVRQAPRGGMQGAARPWGGMDKGLMSGDLKHESRGTRGTGTVQRRDEAVVHEKSPW